MARVRLEEGIDRAWLEREARDAPFAHAYALWDLQHAPDRVRLVVLHEEDRPSAYLLIWYGGPSVPIVHWVGAPDPTGTLVGAVPTGPLQAVVPEAVAPALIERRRPSSTARILMMERDRGSADLGKRGPTARRLTMPEDGSAWARFLPRIDPATADAYRSLELNHEWIAGAFEREEIVAVARAAVRLPDFWIVSGVFTRRDRRGFGYGGAVTAEVTRAANRAGARTGLAVRADNHAALSVYERLGYRVTDRRLWLTYDAPPPT
jgi:GNAT superfamily N-acetyltransferase